MKTNLKKGLFTMILACTALIASAGQIDVVHLKNGSIVIGEIVEQIPNVSLKIKTADGYIFSYQMDEIENIVNEVNYRNLVTQGLTRGYRGFIDFGYTIGVGDMGRHRLEFSTSHGYQFNPYFFAGIGIGVHYYFRNSSAEIPIFAHFRSEFLNNPISPFVDFKIGYSVYDTTGFYATPSVGCRFATKYNRGISLSVGYTAQMFRYQYYFEKSSKSGNWGGVLFKFGFDF